MRIEHPYHEGELLVQERVGELLEGKRNGAAISNAIVKGALPFIAKQSMAVFGSLDRDLNVWASVQFGAPGFMHAIDDQTVMFDPKAMSNSFDPLWQNIERDPRVGLLVIELASRRRIRINGQMHRLESGQWQLDVEEAYPNCPKYIQRRQVRSTPSQPAAINETVRRGTALSAAQRDLIAVSDTLFVSSANRNGGVDASHRGGHPGFVQVVNGTTIRVPDYQGNSMYNTLGNFVIYPRAGIIFIDFPNKRYLQLVGRPEIQWELDDPEGQTGGTNRYWDLSITHWLEAAVPSSLSWEFLDYSPYNPTPAEAGGH